MQIQLIYPTPKQSPFAPIFINAILVIFGSLIRAGYDAKLSHGEYKEGTPAILLGPHLFPRDFINELPRNTIIYNLELMGESNNNLVTNEFAHLLSEFIIWDYGKININFWKKIGAPRVIEVPIGYDPMLERVPKNPEKDIDILLIGSISPRRKAILETIAAQGYNVVHKFGVYGEDLDNLVSRAKILLNIHFFEVGGIETLRLSYLWANKIPVISEFKLLGECQDDLRDFIENDACIEEYDKIPELAIKLLIDSDARNKIAKNAYNGFVKKMDSLPIILHALNASNQMQK